MTQACHVVHRNLASRRCDYSKDLSQAAIFAPLFLPPSPPFDSFSPNPPFRPPLSPAFTAWMRVSKRTHDTWRTVHGYSPEFLRLLSSMFAERDGLEGAASSTGSSRRRVATLISVGNFALSRRIQPRPPLITRLPPLRVGSSDGTDIRPPAIFTHPLGRTFLNRSTVN